eukprot:c5427_g1_i1 orf=111-440(-)
MKKHPDHMSPFTHTPGAFLHTQFFGLPYSTRRMRFRLVPSLGCQPTNSLFCFELMVVFFSCQCEEEDQEVQILPSQLQASFLWVYHIRTARSWVKIIRNPHRASPRRIF